LEDTNAPQSSGNTNISQTQMNYVQQPQPQPEPAPVNALASPKRRNSRIIGIIAVLVVIAILAYAVHIAYSPAKSTTTLTASFNTTTIPSTTAVTTLTTTVAPAQSGSVLSPQSIKNGAEAAEYAIQKLAVSGPFNQTSSINMNTKEAGTVSGSIHDSISFYIGKKANETYFYLTKQTVSSPMGPGQKLNYSGYLEMPRYVNCYGTFCMNSTESNITNGETALFNNFFGPVAEDIGRFISFDVPNNPRLNGTAAYLYNTSLVNYTFEKYIRYDNISCALMHVYVPKQIGLLAVSLPGYIYLNGTTCLSNATGLPLYTNITFLVYNNTIHISANGTFVQTSSIKIG